MRVRDIRPDEYDQLLAIELAADARFEDAGLSGLPDPSSPDTWRVARYVLVCGEPPAGFAAVTEADGQAHLEQVSVHPRQSARGIGAKLVRSALERASSLGYTRMTLLTYADAPWNGPYYRRLGFETLSALGPDLTRMRENERARGLDRHGTRVAMVRELGDLAAET